MSKKDKLKKEKARQTERKRLEELEEQREREMIEHLQNSYRPKIVVYRAAKRLYKKGR